MINAKRPVESRKLIRCSRQDYFGVLLAGEQMLKIKFALQQPADQHRRPQVRQIDIENNEKERRTGCESSRRAAVRPILKEVSSRGPVANLVGNPLRNLLFDVLGWLFLVALHSPIRRSFRVTTGSCPDVPTRISFKFRCKT